LRSSIKGREKELATNWLYFGNIITLRGETIYPW